MKRNSLLYRVGLLTMALALTACNDDNPEAGPTGQGNTNANATRTYNSVTETPGTTDVRQVASRLEMPQLNTKGSNNLFVVHTVPGYGVNYSIEYDCDLKAQRWAAFRWDASNSTKRTTRTDAWAADPLIPQAYQTDFIDHQSNGYTRGHIVASEDRVYSRQANEQTFYYSNMHPQSYSFNTEGIWWNIENRLIRDRFCRFDQSSAGYFCDTLYVVKGGTIDADHGGYTWVRGNGQPLVCPKYFFVALLRKSSKDTTQGGYAAIGFWMEHRANTDTNYRNYAKSIDELEALTGLDFFCNLPDEIERQVESNLVLSLWGL